MNRLSAVANERALVERLRYGDQRTYSELLRRYYPDLVRMARRYVDDQATAEDVARETCLAMLEGFDRFGGRSSLRTRLFHILINCARASRPRTSCSIPFSAGVAHASRPYDTGFTLGTLPLTLGTALKPDRKPALVYWKWRNGSTTPSGA